MEASKFSISFSSPDIYPFPKIEWFKDDQHLENSDNFITDYSDSSFKINFNSAKVSDQGNYKCVLTNEMGSVEGMCNIKVFGIIFIFFL